MESQDSSFPIVGIGTSAGGLEVLKEFFEAMPSDSGMAFVVIQHLDPRRVSHLADILGKYTKMEVAEAKDQMPVEANTVYTIPPNKFMSISNGTLHLTEPLNRDGVRMPIDFFLRSLAEDRHEKAICVLLSGAGSDGTMGLRETRGAGGMTMVQDPQAARFNSMVRSAIATTLVDYVLPVTEMPGAILKYLQQGYLGPERADRERGLSDLEAILDLLVARTKSDFGPYKKATLLRRIERRMGINHIAQISDYLKFLHENTDEVTQLAKDMLINVTSFFRDAEAFEELREKVIAPLIQEKEDGSSLRVWVPGCSTGEESYSIAIMFLEEIEKAKKKFTLQIFASDIDDDGLKFGRAGIYPESIAADVSEERLKRFFTKLDHIYQVNKEMRGSVLFSAQNLITEPPFSRLDLISCRNVMIYLEPDIQARISSVFAFTLNPGGYLFLGKSDGTGNLGEMFSPVSTKRRIFCRTHIPYRGAGNFPIMPRAKEPAGLQAEARQFPLNLPGLNQQVLLKHFDATILLIDEKGNILHFYGPTRKYLEHLTGEASLNLLNMVETKVSVKLRLALRKVVQKNEAAKLERVQFSGGDSAVSVNVTIMPVTGRRTGERLLAIIFEDVHEATVVSPDRDRELQKEDSLLSQLEAELKALQNAFKDTIDEYETTNEELKAANEEVQSANEELQSTNEELETSKEEIQAVNEELSTVNSQLNLKLEELTETTNDLTNFQNSSDIATIFLDAGFRIRRFTPKARRLLNLIAADAGRPVSHISHNFTNVDLVAEAEIVLKSQFTIEREVRTSDNRWYAMRCLPYLTQENRIAGVVFTFTDVSRLKQSEGVMMEARKYAENIVDTVREPLIVLDGELRVISANRSFYSTFQVLPQDTLKRTIYELRDHQWDIPRLRELLEEILPKNNQLADFEVEQDFPALGRRVMLLNARRIESQGERSPFILLAIEDITERKRAEWDVLHSEERLRHESQELEQQLISTGRLVSLGEISASMAHEFNNPLGIIIGFTQDLLSEVNPSDPNYRSLEIIGQESQRCRKIIQDLMEYARPRSSEFRMTDVKDAVEKSLNLIQNRFYKQNVEVANEIKADLPKIHADPHQLEQVLVNLYLNAVDAMPEGGRLTVRASINPVVLGAGPSEELLLTVADTGIGIDTADLPKIFQPFFTARKKSGLGLGLPVCDRIVKNHGGRIEVESQLGKGTTVKLYLPIQPSHILPSRPLDAPPSSKDR